jgi:hypothetical protein
MMELLIAAALVASLSALGIGAYAGIWYRGYRDEPQEFEAEIEKMDDSGHAVGLPAPETSNSLLGLFRANRHRMKAKKLAKKGYVKWYKFDGMLERPKWVKPERGGSGVPKYYDSDDEVHYLFPKDALVTDSRTGAPVAVHHAGQVEPVNLADPEFPPIDADRLEEIINLEIESDPPSWLSKFDFDAQTMMWVAIAIILVFAGAQQLM